MERRARIPSPDIDIATATTHLWVDIDREALVKSRVAPSRETIDASRELLEGVPSALMLEAFVAGPLERLGAHDEALEARDRAIAFLPSWEPWQCAVVLVATSRSLLALGRTQEAADVARTALAHAPMDPHAMAAIAMALGDGDERASLWAALRDGGFPDVPAPSERERTVAPARLALGEVARTSDEELVRLLVLREVDGGLVFKRANDVRLAQALLRHGEIGFARNAAAVDEGDSGLATPVDGWLGLGARASTVWLTKHQLCAELEATDEGKRAMQLARAKERNRYSSHSHIGYRNEFLATASTEDIVTMLFNPARAAVLEALARAPSHPLVARFIALRAELLALFPPGSPNQIGIGTSGPLLHGAPVSYPHVEIAWWDDDRFPPCLELVSSKKAKCKGCKVAFEVGEIALRLGKIDHDANPAWQRWHLECARTKKAVLADLRQAAQRDRRELPGLATIRTALA